MPKILVADDDPDFVETIRMILQAHGYDVASAASGSQALEAMRSAPPDLVLLDVMMETVLDGVSVSHEMHADPQLKEIPVILISSIASSPQAGAFPTDEYIPVNAWMAKPLNPDRLLAKVAELLQQ